MLQFFPQVFENGNRTHFIQTKSTKKGKPYLSINIAQRLKDGNKSYQNLSVYSNEIDSFSQAIIRALIQFTPQSKTELIAAARAQYANAYMPWTNDDDNLLEVEYAIGSSIEELVEILKRSPMSIYNRIIKLRLEEKYILH